MTDKYYAMPDALILELNSAYPIFEDIEMSLGGTGRIELRTRHSA